MTRTQEAIEFMKLKAAELWNKAAVRKVKHADVGTLTKQQEEMVDAGVARGWSDSRIACHYSLTRSYVQEYRKAVQP